MVFEGAFKLAIKNPVAIAAWFFLCVLKIEKVSLVIYTYMYRRSFIIDYYLARPVPSFNYKKFTICIFLVLFLAPNSLGFETNDNSKITANLEVTGSLTAERLENAIDALTC